MKKIIRALILVFALTAVLATFAACEKEQPKTKLEIPIVASQVYTGSKLTAEVPQNDGYRVISNEGGTDAGEYDVVLELTDANKYEWATPDSDDATKVTLKFVVTKATNRDHGSVVGRLDVRRRSKNTRCRDTVRHADVYLFRDCRRNVYRNRSDRGRQLRCQGNGCGN